MIAPIIGEVAIHKEMAVADPKELNPIIMAGETHKEMVVADLKEKDPIIVRIMAIVVVVIVVQKLP
jgi:hypothetical protein